MLIRLLKFLRGYVRIRIEGYSPERLLNLCNANGFAIWGIEKKEHLFEMYISVKDYKKLRPFARKTGTKIILLEKNGLPFFLHRFRKRKMFFAGMFLCVICIYGLSLFIWNIHFEGNLTQTNEELLSYLEELGVSHGTLKSRVICEEIETNLRTKYPNMLWVSAEMRGTRVMIQIKENEDEDIVSKIAVKDKTPRSIVTEYSGMIESIIVRQGTPMVSDGDEVTAGQILVEGYYPIKNDAGEIIRYEGVLADADIYLLAKEEYEDVFEMEYVSKEYTERKRTGMRFYIGGKCFEFLPKIKFDAYEMVADKKEIRITENFYLPFSVEFLGFLEYEPKLNRYTEEEINQLVNFRYQNKYKNILQKGVQIIEKDVKIDCNGKLCKVRGNITLRVPITTKVPVTIPEAVSAYSGEGEY